MYLAVLLAIDILIWLLAAFLLFRIIQNCRYGTRHATERLIAEYKQLLHPDLHIIKHPSAVDARVHALNRQQQEQQQQLSRGLDRHRVASLAFGSSGVDMIVDARGRVHPLAAPSSSIHHDRVDNSPYHYDDEDEDNDDPLGGSVDASASEPLLHPNSFGVV